MLSFVRLGAALDAGTSLFLQRSIGVARARALALLGQPLSAEQAEEWGLIWKMVEDAELMTEALAIAQQLANGPPISLGLIKQQIEPGWDASLADTLDDEAERRARPSSPPICAKAPPPSSKSARRALPGDSALRALRRLIETLRPYQVHAVLILRSPAKLGVSKDGSRVPGRMVRDGATRLLTMRSGLW